MCINKHKLLYFFVTILEIILLLFIKLNISNGFLILAILNLFNLIMFLIINNKISKEIINYSSFFIIILFIFHFGQLILLGLFPNLINNQQITLKYFNEMECINAMRIISFCFYAISLGIILTSNINGKKIICNFKSIDFDVYKKKAFLMLSITFPIKFFVDLYFWYLSITAGERVGVLWLSSFPNFIVAYGNLSIIGFCLLIISLSNNCKKQLCVLLLIISYFLFLMLSGRRSESVVYICILVFFYIKTYKKKTSFLKTCSLGIAAYFFLTFLYTIVYSRNQIGVQNIVTYYNCFKVALLEKNILIEALREYGNTGYTAVCVISLWLKSYSPSYGISLIYSCTAILPNLSGISGKLTELGNYVLQLKEYGMITDYYQNIGGSLFGELLFNFGMFGGIIASFILGIFVSKINKGVTSCLNKIEYMKLIYFIPAMVAILYWVRDVFGGGIRTVVWGFLFIYIIQKKDMRKENESINRY